MSFPAALCTMVSERNVQMCAVTMSSVQRQQELIKELLIPAETITESKEIVKSEEEKHDFTRRPQIILNMKHITQDVDCVL